MSNEIKRPNLQTAAANEPTGVCCSKRQQAVCCICRQNSRCLHEFSNHSCLDKKTGGELDYWEKWNVTTKLYGMNSFHSNTKRKEERSKKWQAKWPTSKFKMSMNVFCVKSAGCIKKKKRNRSMSVLGSAICRSQVSSLVGRGLWQMQISASQNWYKRSNLSIVAFAVSQDWGNQWIAVASEKDRTSCKQLKGFNMLVYFVTKAVPAMVGTC